jgi:carbamoyl-phosphate synthase / aspartate carbamoyltransferase / dihydroorotase
MLITLPPLIDPHVHMREPGQTHKEDWASGTAAALAGGFTYVLAMPNTQPPVTDEKSFRQAHQAAQSKAVCDFGIFLGAGPENAEAAALLAPQAPGLKMYLDQTFGPLQLDDSAAVEAHFRIWPAAKPIVVHAEGGHLETVIDLAARHGKRLHAAHISRADEILLVRQAKERGQPVTCEVTPHHLFLTEEDTAAIGRGRCEVRPPLNTRADQQALWANMDVIDCFATDHAPHTLAEKDGENPPPGFPGLETALGLFLNAVHEGRLTLEDVLMRMHNNPRRIFGLPNQTDTFINVDLDLDWTVRGRFLKTHCAWSPFEDMRLKGKVTEVILRGEVVYREGAVLSRPGSGRDPFIGFRSPALPGTAADKRAPKGE